MSSFRDGGGERGTLAVHLYWVLPAFGGLAREPWVGMRPLVRWQRHLREFLDVATGCEVTSLRFDPATRIGDGVLRLNVPDLVPAGWRAPGALIELLESYRVIAVGKIL